jgi:hypothetical protein
MKLNNVIDFAIVEARNYKLFSFCNIISCFCYEYTKCEVLYIQKYRCNGDF